MAQDHSGESIQEYVDSRGVTLRVDRDGGVLRGVKLIGLSSRNGRRYRESALNEAAHLYEEVKVNVNHPKDGPAAPRDYQDRLGVIRGVEMRSGEGLFGDLHFNPKHSLAEQLAWDAENNPSNVGFSHNVLAKLSREKETTIVEEITQVRSVDLVADPAATRGLFECEEELADRSIARQPSWKALTLESLAHHRPDLHQQMESEEVQRLQTQLDEAQVKEQMLLRRQKIVQLLNRHGLPMPQGIHDAANRIVSSAFLEALMNAADDEQLESLVVERAELIRSAPAWSGLGALRSGRPTSRDQLTVLRAPAADTQTASSFAQALRSA